MVKKHSSLGLLIFCMLLFTTACEHRQRESSENLEWEINDLENKNNNLESKISDLEWEINNLESRISDLEWKQRRY